MFHYKPTREETDAIEAGFRALERISATNTLLSATLDTCFAHDKTQNRRYRKAGLSMASQLELKGRYCNHFANGYRNPGLLARDLAGLAMPAQQLAMIGAEAGHYGRSAANDVAALQAARIAHTAAFDRALDAA